MHCACNFLHSCKLFSRSLGRGFFRHPDVYTAENCRVTCNRNERTTLRQSIGSSPNVKVGWVLLRCSLETRFSREKFSKTSRSWLVRSAMGTSTEKNPAENWKRFFAFIGPLGMKGKRHHGNVTIKFNYAIKLYLIAKCVACGSRFLWRDWLNEINGLLSIFGLFMRRCPCHLPICGAKWTPDGHLHKRVKRSCKFQSQYLHFHLYMPTAVSIIQFSRVCFWCYRRPRTTTCFVFDLDQPRYWSGRYFNCCCCVFLTVTIKVSAIDSQRMPDERKARCAVSDGEAEMENLFLDNSVGRDIKETMKIDWWVSEWNGMGIQWKSTSSDSEWCLICWIVFNFEAVVFLSLHTN